MKTDFKEEKEILVDGEWLRAHLKADREEGQYGLYVTRGGVYENRFTRNEIRKLFETWRELLAQHENPSNLKNS
jgi:hypothetical protein